MNEALPSVWKGVLGNSDLLVEIYKDLASPGVRQVGKALETVIETGALALLPLRLLNATSRAWEERTFRQIADRFSAINADVVEPIRPEIAIPALEKLQYTEDESLRLLFIELLASSASKEYSGDCHPSFVQIISQLSPDEARILEFWKDKWSVPFLRVCKKTEGSKIRLLNEILELPHGLLYPQNIGVYQSNMRGLGLISKTTMEWMEDESYVSIIEHARKSFPGMCRSITQSGFRVPETSEIVYELGIIRLEEFGKLMQKACLPK